MKTILSILFLSVFSELYAQQCNCTAELRFLENIAEHDLPSYQDQVKSQHRETAYRTHKEECNKIAAGLHDENECIYLVAKYISFFRDEHLAIDYKDHYLPFSTFEDTAKIRVYYKRQKAYPLPTDSNANSTGIEGQWESKDKAYIVQVVKHKTTLSDYAGLIIKGDELYWSKGQIKFLLKQKGKNSFESIYLRTTRQPRAYIAILDKSVLTIGRGNIFYRLKDSLLHKKVDSAYTKRELTFKELSDKTNYLSVPDFGYEMHEAIDSIVKVNLAVITSKPNLIIDVRNNFGGADRSYQALLPLVMDTKTMADPLSISILVSDNILKEYKDTRYKNCETKEDSLDDDKTIELMEQHSGNFTPVTFKDTIEVDTVYSYPAKVAILTNRWCASSGEGFVIKAMQNKKVTLYGENTWGMCGYGSWRTVEMPKLPIVLSVPMMKMYFSNNADYESTGIPPKIRLDPERQGEWVNEVVRVMEK